MLGDHKVGWFGEVGYKDLMQVANAPYKSDHKFENMYICDPSAKHFGFKSWDGKITGSRKWKTVLTLSRLLHQKGP